jgi:hypothetical protein
VNKLEDFRKHLEAGGRSKESARAYVAVVRRFLKHVGTDRPERISEEAARSFFAAVKNEKTRQGYAMAVNQFLKFSARNLPAVINRGPTVSDRNGVAPRKLQQKWNVEKLRAAKEENDQLIARLARKVIDHYLFFQKLAKDGDVDLDEVARFTDECRELIESNLPLFMGLSAQGHNVHSAIDERVQR